MKVNWFNKKDSDCVITLSKEDFKNGEFNLNLKLKDYKRTLQKGDLIKFDLGSKIIDSNSQFADEYRVLKINGDKVYVVSMYDLGKMQFGNSLKYLEVTTHFGCVLQMLAAPTTVGMCSATVVM